MDRFDRDVLPPSFSSILWKGEGGNNVVHVVSAGGR